MKDMKKLAAEAIDQLITIEAKNEAMPVGVCKPMYEAAREFAGGQPLAMLAAETLKEKVGKGDVVLVLTGAGYAPAMPKGESDGPPGAASLAKILYKGLGAVPVYVCETLHTDPIVASSHAAGLMVKELHEAKIGFGAALAEAPTSQAEVDAWIVKLFDELQPKAVIATEKVGVAFNGLVHNATGQPMTNPDEIGMVEITGLLAEANKRGIYTIGIGDHGNEAGFGSIREAVERIMPKGDQLCAASKADLVMPVMMSNWGCYGIEAALAFLLKRPDLVHSPAQEERIVRACLDAGGLEAMYCTTDFFVDGLDGETSMAVVQFLGNIVRKMTEAPDTGVAH